MPINSSILFRSNARMGTLRFDSSVSEGHHYSLAVTENPVEYGANITDHAYKLPDEVQLDVAVGDVYYSFSTASQYNLSKRSQDALSRFRQLMINRRPVTVISNLAKYANMLLVDITTRQTKDNASTLLATLSFKELLVVDSNAGSIIVDNNNDQYQQPQNSGTKQLQPDTP